MKIVSTERPSAAQVLRRIAARLCLAGVLSLLAACGGQEEKGTSPGKTPVIEKTKAQVIATIGDLEITRPMLQKFTHSILETPYKNIDPLTISQDLLQPIVEDLALALEAGKRALDPENPVLKKEELDRAGKDLDLLLSGYLYQEEVFGKIPDPTDAQIQAFYENNSDEVKIPFMFSMRQIVVSTYQAVTTTRTTTFEGLAERISGDVTKVDQILANVSDRHARAPDWNTKDRALTTKPLELGEKLLVPLSDEGKKARHKKILMLKARLDAGEDFAAVAKDADFQSGARIDNLPLTGRSMLPQYLEAAHSTSVNGLSKVFGTKHGYHIMKILKKREERVPPLDEVRGQILANKALNAMETSEKKKAYTNGLFRNAANLKVQFDLFRDLELADDTVVVTLGDKSYTRGQLEIEVLGEPGPETSDETILTALMTQVDLILDLEVFQARHLGLDKDPDFLMNAAGRIYFPLRTKYQTAMLARERTRKVSEDDIKIYYEAHKAELNFPKQFECHVLQIQAETPEKAAELAHSAVKDVKSLDDFKKVIREKSTNPGLKQVEGFQTITDSSGIFKPIRTQLTSLPVGTMGPPLFVEELNSALVIWLLNRSEERQQTYDEAKREVSRQILLDRQKTYPEDLKEEMLTEAKVLMR